MLELMLFYTAQWPLNHSQTISQKWHHFHTMSRSHAHLKSEQCEISYQN